MIACDICKDKIDMTPPRGGYNGMAFALVPVVVNDYGYNIEPSVMYNEDASLKGLSAFIHSACFDNVTERGN